MSMFASYGICVTAGSRLRIYGGLFWLCKYELRRCIKVVFPWRRRRIIRHCLAEPSLCEIKVELTEPAMPIQMITTGSFLSSCPSLGAEVVVSGAGAVIDGALEDSAISRDDGGPRIVRKVVQGY